MVDHQNHKVAMWKAGELLWVPTSLEHRETSRTVHVSSVGEMGTSAKNAQARESSKAMEEEGQIEEMVVEGQQGRAASIVESRVTSLGSAGGSTTRGTGARRTMGIRGEEWLRTEGQTHTYLMRA